MKVLITGAGGQLGSALQTMAPQDAIIIAMAKIDLDITDAAAVLRVMKEHKPQLIFNAAAYTDVDRAEHEPGKAQAVNGTAVGVLAAEAVKAGARFVHVSSDYVFGGMKGAPYRPEDSPDPINAYGKSKLDGERAALASDPGSLIVRAAWVYAHSTKNFVDTMLKSMRRQSEIYVVDDQIGTPTYAPGLASALWTLARKGAEGIFHYTDSGVASRYEFASAIREKALALGLLASAGPVIPISTIEDGTCAKRPLFSVLDKSKTWAAMTHTAPHWRTNLHSMLSASCGHD